MAKERTKKYGLKIDKNIPIPDWRKGKTRWKSLMGEMKNGDSILLNKPGADSFSTHVRKFHPELRTVQRMQHIGKESGKVRVWIVKKEEARHSCRRFYEDV